jgi:hypothetical protein
MKVIKFAPGLIPVLKHQEHDQSSHGSWADSGSPKLTIMGKNDGVNEFFNERTRVVRYQPEGQKPKDYVLFADEKFVVAIVKPTDGTTINGYSEWKTNKGEIGHLDITGPGSNPWRSSAKNDNKATIVEVAVRSAHQRRGLASAMLRFHRDLFPELDVQHSDAQLPDGKAWADVAKHQEHDQSSHGNWAEGSQGSSSELSNNEIRDIISGSDTVNEMYQKVAERLGKNMKPKLEDLSEEEINFYRGVTDIDRDAQRLLDGRVTFTPFQTWGQGIYVSSEPDYAARYGDLIRLKLDGSAKLVEGEIAWSKAFSLFDKESSLDMPKILDRITSGKMDNFSDSDIANIYWAAKGYDGYSAYATGRAEVVLFNADKLTVNRADIGAAVKKHQEHDQSSHGNWAGSSSESGLDAMPYEWKPEFKERERLTARELSSEELNLGRGQLQQVAQAPIAIRVSSGDLELRKIVEAGGFKSLTEQPEPTLGYEIDYRQARYELEKGLWGQPSNANSPIYGYFDTPLQSSVDNQTRNYGDVKIVLKDSVAGRTTISPGDSANHGLTPVLVTDARKGNLSVEQVDSAYRSRHFQKGLTSVSQPTRSVRTVQDIDYFEAQIHGGVSLSDIKSVRLEKYSIVGDSTIALLEKAGIEVTRDDK